jgi:hypothetical protein
VSSLRSVPIEKSRLFWMFAEPSHSATRWVEDGGDRAQLSASHTLPQRVTRFEHRSQGLEGPPLSVGESNAAHLRNE